MKVVFAFTASESIQAILYQERPPYVLCSQLWVQALDRLDYLPEYVLLDSGAFSAWNCGEEVSLTHYLPLAQRVQQERPFAWIINLDVIPGEAGRTATAHEIAQGMAQSLQNADTLRGAGLRVMEVFHQNEPFAFLDQLLDRRQDQSDVIGLSPRNDVSVKKRVLWLQSVLGHLVRRFGVKRLPRFHGLAATGRPLLEAFPFYSADSSSWVNAYRFGIAIDERGRGVRFDKAGLLPSTRYRAGQDLMTRHTIRNLQRLEQHVTRLWEMRGVVWSN